MFYGKEYPLGHVFFTNKLRKAFRKNIEVTNKEEIEKLIGRGEFVVKELEALYKLKKYRYLKKSYYDKEPEH